MVNKWLKNLWSFKKQECVCHADVKNLSKAVVGRPLRVECLRAEEGMCQRLREMGFCESSVVEKVADSGALICKVCDSKVIISKGVAEKIIVKDICPCQGHQDDPKVIALSQMSIGQQGIINDFSSEIDGYERMEEMGMTPGERVEIVRYAPLGDPIEIKIRGYCLSLRKQEADLIKVKLDT
ncbi:MAG: ferrous iron transport protein A [Candidatus Omnitrophica bacterium]|nr:ferrous iron transport protein A [Candidatus Omnitrophota bacterium]